MADEDKSVPAVLAELKDLTVTYARQETVDPIKGLGRFIGFGVGGSLVLGIGLILISLAALRAMQTETGTMFTGNWSWVPYLITVVLLGGLAALAVNAIRKDSREAEARRGLSDD